MAETTPVKVAIITAISAVAVAVITTLETIYQTENRLQKMIANIGQLEEDIEKHSKSKCPSALTKENLALSKSYGFNHEGSGLKRFNFIDLSGPGCLISGSIAGYYFQEDTGGTNYTIMITIDGTETIYPRPDNKTGDVVQAYGQNGEKQNTGILVLPPIEFSQSLKVSFVYPGGGKEISANAIVIQRDN